MVSDSSPSVVGQTSGQLMYPKNTTTTLPLKSASVRVFPVWSLRLKSRPNAAPVISDARNVDLTPTPFVSTPQPEIDAAASAAASRAA